MNNFKLFNPYNIEELYSQRSTIVDLKNSGYTIKEITEMAAEKVTKAIEFSALMAKVKSQWDNWLRIQRNQDRNNKASRNNTRVVAKETAKVEVTPKLQVDVDSIDMGELKKNGFVTIPNPYNGKEGLYNNELICKTIVTEDGSLVTPEMLMRAHNLDPLCWEIVDFKPNYWQSQRSDGTALTLCQSKVRVRPVSGPTKKMWEDAFKEAATSMAKNNTVGIPSADYKEGYGTGSELAICSIADLHFGKLGFKQITGEDFNSDVAAKRFEYIINKYIESLKYCPNVGKILFYWCQDFFHYDSKSTCTTAGTKQDSDLVWQLLLTEGFKLIVNAIKRLEEIAPVETMYVASNHDEHTGFSASFALKCFFENNYKIVERNGDKVIEKYHVTVNAEPTTRKYYRWGNGLYGFAHGDKEGKRISQLMQVEARKAWGITYFHEWFLGHFHSEHCRDEGGVKARYLGSPSGSDNWHSQSGFCGAQKEAYIFIRDKKYGPVADIPIILSNQEMQEPDFPEYEGWIAEATY